MAGVGGAAGIIAGGALVMMGAVGAVWLGLRAIYLSIKPRPPTERQLKEENLNQNPLFRHFEVLKAKIAWRQIGDYPTPCHSVQTATPSGVHVEFSVKREDLASALYGGNKLRTLQHQVRLHPLSCRTLSLATLWVATARCVRSASRDPPRRRVCSYRELWKQPDRRDKASRLALIRASAKGDARALVSARPARPRQQ